MSEPLQQESPLAQFFGEKRGATEPETAQVVLTEKAFLGHLNVRGDEADAAFVSAVKNELGNALPVTPNTVTEGEGATICWLGPNEWLLIVAPGRDGELAAKLGDAFAATFAAVTDVGSGQTVVNLRGPRARDVLAKGCPLDLHPREFAVGQCAQTHLAKTGVLIRCVDDGSSYDLVVRRSFADYLARWIADAAREYGLELG
jgi:sarcosine oxidase subunit gamma